MLKDERARGLATEFGGNWLDFRRFEKHNAVDRERFPSFTNDLREAMFQEPIRFIDDVIHNDRSVLDLLYGNYTFVNPVLAKHYGMPEVKGGDDTWVRVDDAGRYQRGGLLPMAVFLTAERARPANQPGEARILGGAARARRDHPAAAAGGARVAARTKPNRICRCATCWPGIARMRSAPPAMRASTRSAWRLKATGRSARARTKDLAGRPVDTKAVFPGGSQGTGFEGVQAYIREHRQNDFLDNFSRKLLAYALNRSLLLSDEPTVERMEARLAANGYRFSSLVETIVTSPQFLNKRNPECAAKSPIPTAKER